MRAGLFQATDPVAATAVNGMGIDTGPLGAAGGGLLARAGYISGRLAEAALPSNHVALDRSSRLPVGPVARDLYTRKFLIATSFALGPTGSSGWAGYSAARWLRCTRRGDLRKL